VVVLETSVGDIAAEELLAVDGTPSRLGIGRGST
jgi:hypothetical protein